MKTAISLIMALVINTSLYSQNQDSTASDTNKNADTTNIMLGKKEIRIIENEGETDIKVMNRNKAEREKEIAEEEKEKAEVEMERAKEEAEIAKEESENKEENDFSWNDFDKKHSGKKFKGHWDAFQIGINSYLAADKITVLPASDEFMALNTNKSINVNLNMFQQSFGLIGRNFGVLTGLGLEFSNYAFDNNNTIVKNASGYIIPSDPGFKLDKSKLTTTYLTVPLLLEFQFPGERRSSRLFVNGGVIGGLKIGSHTKIKYKEDGDKRDDKNKNDFNLSTFRYGFTGRIGLQHLSIYGVYYPVALFEKNKGPELYPFMIGLSFDGF